jgi:putative transposase
MSLLPMTLTATKTIEAYLLSPTKWKEEALKEEVAVYREAFQHAHSKIPSTKTEVNDIVTQYELAWQAKDALKNHLPDLAPSDEPRWEQPVRYTNRAAKFDRDTDRTHEICWRVPQAGYGTSFWIPLQINPNQRSLWNRVTDQPTRPDEANSNDMDEELDVGQVRLQQESGRWVLHVTVTVDVNSKSDRPMEDMTPIGFDVGISQLLVGCALENGKPNEPFFYNGGPLCHARQKQEDASKRLQRRDADRLNSELSETYERKISQEIEQATRAAVDYASKWPNPVIVLENIRGIAEDTESHRINQWAYSKIQSRLEEKATEIGIRVEYVSAKYTSQLCHACNRIGSRHRQAEFRCPWDDCWVSEYQADINAAANIANRLNPWGESLPLDKETDNDVSGSGAPVTAPQDTSRNEGFPSERRSSDDNV